MGTPCERPPCSPEELCQRVANLEKDMETIWRDTYEYPESLWIFTGNIGVPIVPNTVDILNQIRPAYDTHEYLRGCQILNRENANGLFLVGGSNFDKIVDPSGPGSIYELYNQEAKFSGLSGYLSQRKIYPVFGRYDWTPAVEWYTSGGSLTLEEAVNLRTMLHIFPYLPDAKRYYSIYDPLSQIEFFILSGGKESDYFNQTGPYGYDVYPDDILVGGSQHQWFVDRASKSTARHKVVVFSDPFVAVPNFYNGGHVNSNPENHVVDWFAGWDFQGVGVKLIINGHVGSSYHLTKGEMNIVGTSMFSRSRSGVSSNDAYANNITQGQPGWYIKYLSDCPHVDSRVFNHPIWTNIPVNPYDKISNNGFLRIRSSHEKLVGEFVSYDPYVDDHGYSLSPENSPITTLERTIGTMKIEHSFEILS